MATRARRQAAAQSKATTTPATLPPQLLTNAPYFLHWDGGPFTPEGVYALLRYKVLKDDSKLPLATGPAITTLTHALNMFWWKVKGWTGPWHEEQEQLKRIGDAIWVLTEILPKQREEYAAVHAAMERWNLTAAAANAREPITLPNVDVLVTAATASANARADLAAFDALVTAAHAARKRGLPLALNMMLATSKPTKRFKDFAPDLAKVFQSALPNRPKAALYRFIVAATFIITSKETTLDAVQTAFKKNRFDRGKRTD